MKQKARLYCGTTLVAVMLLAGFACPNGTKNLAVASDSVAHALLNAQAGVNQAVVSGVMTQADANAFNAQLANVSVAGLALDGAIKGNESAASVSAKLTVFLTAFDNLQKQGVVGIKDKNTQLEISTIITGAESSIAIIAAAVGTGGK